MENKNITDLRWQLQQLSSQQLMEVVHMETEKETPDDDLVLTALRILEERDAEKPVELGPKSQEAWEAYQKRVKARAGKPVLRIPRFVKAASIVLVTLLLFATIPQQATAGSAWKILTDWTDDFFQYRNIGSDPTEPEEYVFQSDNPGLQQVYEAVVEHLGVTEPVVVQWLPEGNELVEIRRIETDGKLSVHAYFKNGGIDTVLAFNKMIIDRSPQYDKSVGEIEEYEVGGIIHSYMYNNSAWSISWTQQNIKCSISVDCQEDVMIKIIQSIYENGR